MNKNENLNTKEPNTNEKNQFDLFCIDKNFAQKTNNDSNDKEVFENSDSTVIFYYIKKFI